jgi:hypothetical protein
MNATNDIMALHAKVMKTGCATTATIKVNGQKCLVKVSPSKDGQQQVHVSTLRAPLGMRECSRTEFTYDEKHIGEQLGKFSEEIIEAEVSAMCEKTISTGKDQESSIMINDRKCEINAGFTSSDEAYVVISYTPPDSQKRYHVCGFMHRRGESLAEHIVEASKKVLQSEELHLLFGAEANGIESVAAPIIECLHQPIAEEEVDVRMGEIGTILENVRTFVGQNSLWADGLSILKMTLDKLVGNKEMIQGSNGNSSISDCDNPACRKVTEQVEELKMFLDAKASNIGDIVSPIIERLHQPIAEGEVDEQMGQIRKMLEDVKAFVRQHPMSEGNVAILQMLLNKLISSRSMIPWSGGSDSINDRKDISPACHSVVKQVKDLKVLLNAEANKFDSVIAPIVERLSQPIPQEKADVQVGEIGKILEDVKAFVQQNPVSESNVATLQTLLDKLVNNRDMIPWSNGSDSISDRKDIPACRSVVKQVKELKLLLNTKASRIESVTAPIIECLRQSIPQGEVDVRMEEIGKMLEGVKTFVQQNPISEADMSALKAALTRLVSNKYMIQQPNGNCSISEYLYISPPCRKVADQVQDLELLLGAKVNGIESVAAPVIERLHQSIPQGEVDAQMEQIGTILEDVKTFVQQNPVSGAGISVLRTALIRLAGNMNMLQWLNRNYSINDRKDISSSYHNLALQIQGLKLLLDAKTSGY